MYPKTLLRPWLVASALLVLTMLAAPATAGAQQAVAPDSGVGLRIARPRGAVLSVYDGAAETFLFGEGRDADNPVRLAPTNVDAGFALWADYEALFLPLTAGFGRFEISAARVHGDALELLDEDHVDIVSFGPSRRSGRLSLRLRLEPGLHELELAAVSRVRPVGVTEWTIDSDSRRVWVFVAGGGRTPLAASFADTDDVDQSAQQPVLPVGGLSVGAQRGVAAPEALGALNFATGHDTQIYSRVGQEIGIWSDYELWWSEEAAAAGSAMLAVFPSTADGSVAPAPMGSDAHSARDGSGPRLDDGSLRVGLRFDQPGTYRLLARLTTTMSRGITANGVAGETASDSDLVPFTVVVQPNPPRTGNIAGVVYGRTDAPTLSPAGEPDLTSALPLEGVRIVALNAEGKVSGATTSNADGRYRIEGLPPGSYLVSTKPAPQNYLDQWWKLSQNPRNGETVAVRAGETSDGIRFLLVPGATITGKVSTANGRPLAGVEITIGPWRRVQAETPEPVRPLQDQLFPGNNVGNASWRTRTNAEGFYAVDRLPRGAYWVRARDPQGRYRTEYFDNALSLADAEPVKVEAGDVAEGIDFALGEGGHISGTVVEQSELAVWLPLGGMDVEARAIDAPDQTVDATSTRDDGSYRLGPLPEGRYLVRASDPSGNYHAEWFRETGTAADAEPVPVREGENREDVTFTLEPRERETRVVIDPRELVVAQGATGRFAVTVAEVADLGAFEIVLEWQPGLIEVEEVLIGDFLGSTGREVIPVEPQIDNDQGRLAFAAASLGRPAGPSGKGVLFWVRFSAVEMGDTRVEIADSLLTDPAAAEIGHERLGGAIKVGGCLYADFNCDCRVDIRDVMEVVVRWGMVEGDPDWDPRFDLRPDGRIDVIDVQIVAGEWGKRCTGQPEPGSPDPASSGSTLDLHPSDEVDQAEGIAALAPATSGEDARLGSDHRQALPFALVDTDAGLRISASPAAPRVGETVTVLVEVTDATDLAGFEMTLAFDAARLAPLGAEAGAFLGSSGRTVTTLGPELTAGGVTLAAFTLPGAEAASGEGELAIFRFQVLAEGAAAVALEEALLVDSLGDSGAAATEGVTVTGLPAGPPEARAFIPMATRR